MLQIPPGIPGNINLCEAVARAGDQHGHVDDEAAQVRDGGLEAGQDEGGRPDVGREVLGEGLGGEGGRGDGAVEGGGEVEGAVGVVGALEGVDLAVFEGFLAEGPAG